MSVLATKITKAMVNRAGYIPIDSVPDNGGFCGLMDDDFVYYTFKDCLKVTDASFTKWICYWEGYPFAMVCEVKADKLANGFVKIAVIQKSLVPVSEVGEYPSKRNVCFGNMLNGRFLTNKNVNQYVSEHMNNLTRIGVDVTESKPVPVQKSSEKTVLSNSEIKNLKAEIEKNWGISLK